MSILSSIEAFTNTNTQSGFHTEALNPDNFQNINDLNLFSQITSFMGSTAGVPGTSASKVTLNFTQSRCSTPIATRTTRKIKVKAWIITDMTSAPGGASCIAGIRYSVNNGGAYTTILEINNVTPGVYQDNGGPTDYEVLIAVDDFNLFRIEAYTNANSGPGGATNNVPYARVFAFAGYFEDFESTVNLMVIHPVSSTINLQAGANTGGLEPVSGVANESNARDSVLSTKSAITGNEQNGSSFHIVDTSQDLNYAAQPIGGGVINAQLIYFWNTIGTLSGIASGEFLKNTCECKENSTETFTNDGTPNSLRLINAVSVVNDLTVVTFYVRDITAKFRTIDQVIQRGHSSVHGSATGGTDGMTMQFYEGYMELRVSAGSSGAMGGWEPL